MGDEGYPYHTTSSKKSENLKGKVKTCCPAAYPRLFSPPSQSNNVPLIPIPLPGNGGAGLAQRLSAPQRSIHGQTLHPKVERHFAPVDPPLAADLRDFASGVEGHCGVFGEEGDDVHVVRDVCCVLGQGEGVPPAVDVSGL